MDTGILKEDRDGIVEALLRLAAAHPAADVESAALRLCRAVSAVRRYDDRVCATEGASATDGQKEAPADTGALEVEL